MTIRRNSLEEKERKLLDYILEKYPASGPNAEAESILDAIKQSFSPVERESNQWVSEEFLHLLASCARAALEYGPGEEIPWDSAECDFMLVRLFREYTLSLVRFVRHKRLWKNKEKVQLFGFFPIPTWFIESVRYAPHW